MADRTQVSITRRPAAGTPARLSRALGEAAAGVLSRLIEVVDREDRLESGSGSFRRELAADAEGRKQAVEEAVLRAVRMATDPINFRILEMLATSDQSTSSALAARLGLPRLAVEERISDLVSAGLAVKVFSSGGVSGTEAGAALVETISGAAAAGLSGLGNP